jgi:ribonuclease D
VTDRLLERSADVEALAARARAEGSVAIDTEFMWERTYAPQLCLVQIAVGDEIVLIDPLAGASLDTIAALVGDPAVEIVMHAPSADLLAFGLHHGTRPTRVFDTQLVAGFVGLTASSSLERLLRDALQITVGHHESFSDWKRRPLSPSQVQYAGDDVRHLVPLARELERRLDARGRRAWAEAELARRYPSGADPIPDPNEAWRKVQRRGKLSTKQLGVLRTVAAWREREARRRDLPVSWVLKDPSIVEISRVCPANAEQLGRIRGVNGSIKPRDAEGLLEAVAAGIADGPIEQAAAAPPAVQRRADAASGLAGTLLKVRCQDAGIAPELVATRSELERFMENVVLGSADADPLGTGWRYDLVGHELVELVSGRVSLSLVDRPPFIVIQPLA